MQPAEALAGDNGGNVQRHGSALDGVRSNPLHRRILFPVDLRAPTTLWRVVDYSLYSVPVFGKPKVRVALRC
ncbi:hypothetical protein GCM10011352_34920 [Marinobacterium zhoushanense]|uniref:Uncharacterized protein n=1 Tax=Marinobacterium zhoushanense TaxID=1679163 RepID=A0ABQ1KPJ6_9GAMM|nr:hypothetical protein GCM10011352_34920 [Marinobacterium zhoushanense]